MKLNYDVLVAIMSHLGDCSDSLESRRAIGRFMRTCRTLYAAGVSYIMDLPICLDKSQAIKSFYYFLLRDPARRFQYPRHLIIYNADPTTIEPREMIAYILENALQIEKLVLRDADVVKSHKRIPPAICSLPNLLDFTLDSGSKEGLEEGLRMLQKIKSPLRKVKFEFMYNTLYSASDPIQFLASVKDTLEELELTYVKFTSLAPQYPQFKRLTVTNDRPVVLEPLLRCFPNLRELYVTAYAQNPWFSYFSDGVNFGAERIKNQASQASNSWSSLDYLGGNPACLYALAVQCPVHYMYATVSINLDNEIEMLAAVISDSQPSSLSIDLHCGYSTFDLKLLPLQAISTHALTRLTALKLRFQWGGRAWYDPSTQAVRHI